MTKFVLVKNLMTVFINSAYCVHGSLSYHSFENIKSLRQRRGSFDGRHHTCRQQIDHSAVTTYQVCHPPPLFNHHSLQLITTLYLNGSNEKKHIFIIISPAVKGFFFVFPFVKHFFFLFF